MTMYERGYEAGEVGYSIGLTIGNVLHAHGLYASCYSQADRDEYAKGFEDACRDMEKRIEKNIAKFKKRQQKKEQTKQAKQKAKQEAVERLERINQIVEVKEAETNNKKVNTSSISLGKTILNITGVTTLTMLVSAIISFLFIHLVNIFTNFSWEEVVVHSNDVRRYSTTAFGIYKSVRREDYGNTFNQIGYGHVETVTENFWSQFTFGLPVWLFVAIVLAIVTALYVYGAKEKGRI